MKVLAQNSQNGSLAWEKLTSMGGGGATQGCRLVGGAVFVGAKHYVCIIISHYSL